MSRLKKIIIILATAALAICSAPFVSYLMTDDISIELAEKYSGLTFADGLYYYLDDSRGLMVCGIPDRLITDGNFKGFFIDGEKIYCYKKVDNKKSYRTVLYAYDKNTGTQLGEFEVPDDIYGEIHDGIVYGKYTQKVTNKPYLRFYDINNDFREVFVENERLEYGDITVFRFDDGREIIVSPDKSLIELDSDHLITLEKKKDGISQLIFDYFEKRAPSYSDIPDVGTWKVAGDKLYTVYTETRFFANTEQKKNELRHNRYDAVRVYDTETGVIVAEKQFRRAERVISVNDDTIITYFSNNYFWYDSTTFEEIKSQPADEIETGGKYTFTTVEGIVFIFKDEKMLGRIAHKPE